MLKQQPKEGKSQVTFVEKEEELSDVWRHLMEIVFEKRDLDGYIARCRSDLTLIGTGLDEYATTREHSVQLTRRDLNQAPEPLGIHFHDLSVQMVTEDVAVVQSQATIDGVIGDQLFVAENARMSGVLHRQGEEWKLVHMHNSLPNRSQAEGEAYPIQQLSERRRRIDSEADQPPDLRERAAEDWRMALERIRQLTSLLHLCTSCRKIEDEGGHWTTLESYVERNAEVDFSHGLCPDCLRQIYPYTYHRLYGDEGQAEL